MKNIAKILSIFLLPIFIGGCANNSLPGPRLRAIEQVSDLSNEEIRTARDACHLISATDYNCAALIPPEFGMTENEWNSLHQKTKVCRRNQMSSFHQCMKGKGLQYSEFN